MIFARVRQTAAPVGGAGVVASAGASAGPSAGPSAIVRADSGAVWSQRAGGTRNEIVLVRGGLSIHVDHASRSGPLVVLLPDGELEDTGTTFSVSAADGETTRVAVQEGSVVLRIHGRLPITVDAGETWLREPRPVAPAAAAGDPALSPAPAQWQPTAAPTRAAAPHRSLAARAPAAPADVDVVPGASVEFRAAMAVLDVGANRDAAAAFARFLVRYPRDPRAEDAAYLRVIALQRCAADDDMRRAASEYLRLYPAGFRRAEVEKLSR
jgi:hypothetical protein